MQKGFTVKQGMDLPLGLSYQNRCFWFAVSLPRAKSCNLVLFKIGETMPAEVLPMDASAVGVFTIGIILPQKNGNTEYEYLYEADGVRFCDPYAGKINGRDLFGEKAEYVRAGVCVPKQMGLLSEYRHHTTEELILYKLHVRGFTKSPNSGVKKKGTYAGVTEKIPYLKELGVNGVLLLPVTEFDEREAENSKCTAVIGEPKREYAGQKKKGQIGREDKEKEPQPRINYWGYASGAYYFAPKSSYAAQPQRATEEFQKMVETLHAEGIDVYLEMMFDPECTMTYMAECLRYWVKTYAVDGFHINDALFPPELAAGDPYLSHTVFFTANIPEKLQKEQSGRFIEYSDEFCMDSRRYLKGDEGMVPTFSRYLQERIPGAPRLHYITDHNGFTLADLYSYDVRHNEENGEKGRDGTEYNAGWNCGEEGETKKRKVLRLRRKMQKNAMLTMVLSQGIPMILAGDEFLRTKHGNNNSYCQDNEISWLDWSLLKKNREFFGFTKELIAFRKSHPMFTMERELKTTDCIACGFPEVSRHGCSPWQVDAAAYNRLAAYLYCGDYIRKPDKTMEDSFCLVYNMHWEKHGFELPRMEGATWNIVFCTGTETSGKTEERSIMVFQGVRK